MPLIGGEKPRKGVYSLWNVAPTIADEIGFSGKELFPSGIEKIECRFQGLSPSFVAIVHTKDGRMYAIGGNSEFLGEEEYEDIGFNSDKYGKIMDSMACPYAVYMFLASDITREELKKHHEIDREEYEELKRRYNDYTADFTL